MRGAGMPRQPGRTRARNDAKDEAYALDNRSGRVNLYLTVERVARPICVRNR